MSARPGARNRPRASIEGMRMCSSSADGAIAVTRPSSITTVLSLRTSGDDMGTPSTLRIARRPSVTGPNLQGALLARYGRRDTVYTALMRGFDGHRRGGGGI